MKNFRFLDELIHSGEHEIFLDSDIVLEDGEELKYSEGINVDVDFITLKGNAHTIDARGMARIFKVFASGIRFNNIHFKRGFSKSFGGAIHNRGYSQLNIHDSVFESNHACGDGGAIYSECKLFVNNCRFTNNSSSSNEGQ